MSRALLPLALLATLGGCILLPPSIRERAAEMGEGGSAEGGAAEGGSGGMGLGGEGGSETGPLPVCAPGEEGDCATLVELAPGDYHSCALASDGYVRCWGSHWHGQVGDPAVEPADHVKPRVVPELANVDELDAGTHHTCARVGGEVYCWGKNDYSQLGVLDLIDRPAPTKIAFDQPVRQVSAEGIVTCVLTTSDEVYCWGHTLNGQNYLGIDVTPVPTKVEGLDDLDGIAEIGVGAGFACALSSDRNTVRCWGRNATGALGDGSGISSVVAVTVSDTLATPVDQLFVGAGSSCATGGMPLRHQCWGHFTHVLADHLYEPTDLPLEPSSPIVKIGNGWSHICRYQADGFVRCLGLGNHGELGPQATIGLPYAEPVAVMGGVAAYESGWQLSCAMGNDGQLRCWGRNDFGQSDPTSGDLVVPQPAVIDFGAP